jgi:hypothetical protein
VVGVEAMAKAEQSDERQRRQRCRAEELEAHGRCRAAMPEPNCRGAPQRTGLGLDGGGGGRAATTASAGRGPRRGRPRTIPR